MVCSLWYLIHRNDVGVRIEKEGLERGVGARPSQDGHDSTGTHLRHGDGVYYFYYVMYKTQTH